MKSRFTSRLLVSLFALPLLSLAAQDQAAPDSGNPSSAPASTSALQIQDTVNPAAPASVVPADQGGAAAPAEPDASSNPTLPATPDPATPDPSAPAANSGQGSTGENPPPSDPNSLIPPPAEPEQPSPINAAGNEEKQRQDQKTRYYSAKVKADKEEGLASLLQKADKAKSEEAKRQTLREYYDLLAKRMKKIDPSISEWVDTMHAAYLRRLAQVKIEPTIPVNVPPLPDSTGSSSGSASPTPSKKSKAATRDEAPAPKKKKPAASSNN